ncbi:MAG: Na+/H+ antiporter subunit E [Proteobacteria bacterium]|nr:Na+/H+ antiporter subunit E [Pseudomonadota bacterium]MBU1688477.1 Na+/H+ antiporter subunit E [Pseudomonadota bacterium]
MYFLATFLIMFGFWILLSGIFDFFHLSLGVLASLLVAGLSSEHLFRNRDHSTRLVEAWRFLLYIPWVIKEIILSTLHVAFLALHPDMMKKIAPRVVTFKTKLHGTAARVTLANSITLTPGTITIRITDDVYAVHALSDKVARALPGEMEDRIATIFGETRK